MSYIEKRKQIDTLQEQISSYGELSTEIKKKINYKFRLDWNYYSNNMEGNTLTMDETRSVMVGNLTVGGKPIKDVLEIKGHDEIISEILRIGKGEVRLSEKRIKEIHKGIMHEENESEKAKIGKWKTEPNYILNYKGERFDFVPPAEVPERIHKLLDATNAAIDIIHKDKGSSHHPIDVALNFHLEYVLIHPFHDGNGRTARILTNLILISFGYPPFWVKSNERGIYNQYIGDIQGYGGNEEFFFGFAADQIIRSQKILLDAIAGNDIDEPEDLDKRIALLEKELEAVDPDEEVRFHLSKEVFLQIYNAWLANLLRGVIPAIQKFNKLFRGGQHHINLASNFASTGFVDEPVEYIIGRLKTEFELNDGRFPDWEAITTISTNYGTLIKGGLKTFGCNYSIEIKCDKIKYVVLVDSFTGNNTRNQEQLFEKLLHSPLNSVEIKLIVKKFTDTIFDHIDFYTRKSGLR